MTERPKFTRDLLEPYLDEVAGEFSSESIRRHFGIESQEAKNNLRQMLNRMVKEGALRRGRRDGWFDKVDSHLETMDWSQSDGAPLPLLWPLDLHKYVNCFGPGIAIISGSSNAGKTAFCMNFACLNQGLGDKLAYFDNESGPQLYARRLREMGEDVPPAWKVYVRDQKFEDVVDPDAISVIDYIPVPEEAYKLTSQVDAIWRKLRTGFCVIALQKPKGRDDAFGGFGLRARAQLYMALDYDHCYKLKVVKAKVPVNPAKNPNEREWAFNLRDGVHFENVIDPFK